MKNFKTLCLTVFTAMSFIPAFGQLKVIADGKVGIGTSTPLSKLDVRGTILLDNSPTNSNFISGPSNNNLTMEISQGTNSFTSRAFFAMKGNENGGPASGQFTLAGKFVDLKYGKTAGGGNAFGSFGLRLTETGNVGIGTLLPSAKLHVAGDIFATGTITSSDKNLKQNIQEFNYGLETIKKIRPVTYQYNGRARITSERNHVGVIAQDLQEVAPFMVFPYTHKEFDDDNYEISSEDFLAVDEKPIQYMLVNAIKEQQEIIEAQSETIELMEERITRLEKILINSVGNVEVINSASQIVELSSQGELKQNQPNPFSEETVIQYSLPANVNQATMVITDKNGAVVKRVALDASMQKGQLIIRARELTAGVYNYSLLVDGSIFSTKQMVLTR